MALKAAILFLPFILLHASAIPVDPGGDVSGVDVTMVTEVITTSIGALGVATLMEIIESTLTAEASGTPSPLTSHTAPTALATTIASDPAPASVPTATDSANASSTATSGLMSPAATSNASTDAVNAVSVTDSLPATAPAPTSVPPPPDSSVSSSGPTQSQNSVSSITSPPALSPSISSNADAVSASATANSSSIPFTTITFTTTTATDTITEIATEPPTTVTVTAPAQTVTQTMTVAPPPSSPTVEQTTWVAPPQMTDLSAFNVTHFAYGQDNLQLVDAQPSASGDGTAVDTETNDGSAPDSGLGSLITSVLQLFYPANSINPTADIPGGADFYATPLDLSIANNISLEYSVYFPPDFDWVQAGKLPGIYGGHTACSGGDAAVTCFSTRLMWRSHGAGELYLYAPKDKQTDDLCSTPPRSVCDADYGLSVGRGSFHFAAGNWTHVRQTVSLNTPGQQDGGFVLEVNGEVVIDRSDVFYRDVPQDSSPDDDGTDDGSDDDDDDGGDDDDDDDDGNPATTAPAPDQSDDGGLLGGLINGLLPRRRNIRLVSPVVQDDSQGPVSALSPTPTGNQIAYTVPTTTLSSVMESSQTPATVIQVEHNSMTVTSSLAGSTATQTATPTTTVFVTVESTDVPISIEADVGPKPIGFTGLFFSTFFGGHDPEYASPKDQYTWFANFAMSVNG